jgi:hypothetical protein
MAEVMFIFDAEIWVCFSFLAVSFGGYCVVRLPANPQCANARFRLAVG